MKFLLFYKKNQMLRGYLLLVFVFLCFPLSVNANQGTSSGISSFDFSVKAQSLQDSLIRIAAIAGQQIAFQSHLTAGKQAPPLYGNYSLANALQLILHDSGLAYKDAGDVIVIIPEPEDNPAKLAPIKKNIHFAEVITVGERHTAFCCDAAPSTATKTYVDTIEIPKSLEGITQQLFYDRGNTTLTEALRDYSSVSVINDRGSMNIRGFNLPPSAVLKDGHSVVSNGVMPRPLQNIEGIEIAKGVNSSLYGYGEAGGVINLISKLPKNDIFTRMSVKAGNLDSEFGVDLNLPFSENFLHRSNFYYRQENNNDSKYETEQIQFAPDFSYQFENGSELRWSFEYLKQKQIYGRGLRPYDSDGRAAAIADLFDRLGLVTSFDLQAIKTTFDLVYPIYSSNTTRQPEFYPTSGADEKEPRTSRVVDFQMSFHSRFDDNWESTAMLYLGKSEEEITYYSDFFILVNTYFDPENSELTPILLDNLYLSVAGLSVSNVNLEDQFKEVFPFDHPVVPLFFTGTNIEIPLWKDDRVHFYQQPFEQKTEAKKISAEYYVNGEIEWFDMTHEVLMGVSYVDETFDNNINNLYSKEIFALGDTYLNVSSSVYDQALGWALKRYAITTWYDPFAPPASVKNNLPTVIAEATGLGADQQFKLDGSFHYSSKESEITSAGLFVQDHITLSEQWRLNMSAGWYHYKSQQYSFEVNSLGILIGERLPMEVTVEPEFDVFIPHVGVVYLPRDDFSIYLSYGEQFNIVHYIDSSGSVFEPEETESTELGSKWWINKELIASVAFFEMRRTGWIVNDADDPDYFSQAGELISRGVEINLTGFITPQIKIASNVARHDMKYHLKNETEFQLADVHFNNLTKGVPEKMATLWLQYYWQDYGTRGWSLGVGVNYIGESEIDNQRLVIPIDSYTLLDMGLSYTAEDFQLSLSIDNVTDEEWISGYSGVLSDFGYSPQIQPGNSRRFRLGLDLFF